jgi:hypothetical protein
MFCQKNSLPDTQLPVVRGWPGVIIRMRTGDLPTIFPFVLKGGIFRITLRSDICTGAALCSASCHAISADDDPKIRIVDWFDKLKIRENFCIGLPGKGIQ